ncbi:hypothetical protein AAVH_32303 [Aphelenchoides avenae]|nr:hypothetical protein AAVH_32303 [Aphelenchus avenae]
MPPSASTIFASLAGTWRLTRRISDRLSQLHADVEGTATFSATPSEPSELHYDEQVTVRWSHGEQSTASKKYHYRLNAADESITQFNCVGDAQTELERMYDLRFEAKGGSRLVAKGDFLCGQDRYKASYDFASSLDRFRLDYEVRGPKKDYSTFTVYSRVLEE